MTTILTAIVVIAFFSALTYMAIDLIGKNKQARKPTRHSAKEQVSPPRYLIPQPLKQIPAPQELPAEKPIASKEEILQFWTEVMNDPKTNLELRLKASELLGLYYSE